MKFTFPNNSALLLNPGFGISLSLRSLYTYLRVGYKLKQPLFFTTEYFIVSGGCSVLSIGIGYSMGGNACSGPQFKQNENLLIENDMESDNPQ